MSDQIPVTERPNSKATRKPRGMFTMTRLLICLVLIAAAQLAWRYRSTGINARLHADHESAVVALDEALEQIPPSGRLEYLLKLRQDPNPGLRYAVVDALGKEHSKQAADSVEDAFTDSSSMVRQRALEVLPGLDRERGLRVQLAGLRDEDYWIRDAASSQMALLMGKDASYVDKRALPMLVRALDDPDEVVNVMSLTAIKKLTGQKWRYPGRGTPAQKHAVLAACREWWAENKQKWTADPSYSDVAPIRPLRTDPAPRYAFRDIDGKECTFDSQKGRVTLLSFWGTWCGPCRLEVNDIQRLHQDFQSKGVDVIGIANAEKDKASLKEWCSAHGLTYRQAMATAAMMDEFGSIEEVPVSLMLDGSGRIRYRWDGPRDYDTFKRAAERLLAEQTATR